jgi:molybdenum cofactor cytidylyltransferase
MRAVGAVILAAGESSRLGRPKQLIQFCGKSLLRGAFAAAHDAGCSPIVAVLGSDREGTMRELEGTNVIFVENENWRRGIGTSIRAGVETLLNRSADIETIVLLVCDQPFVDGKIIEQLIARREKETKPIVASAYAGTLGVPALFHRSVFAELLVLGDESGAKPVILRDPARVAELPFENGAVDIDTAADCESLTGRDAPPGRP